MRIDKDIGSINVGLEGLGFTLRGLSPITFSLSRSIEGMPRFMLCQNIDEPDEGGKYIHLYLGDDEALRRPRGPLYTITIL